MLPPEQLATIDMGVGVGSMTVGVGVGVGQVIAPDSEKLLKLLVVRA